jgi:hypothetical protein
MFRPTLVRAARRAAALALIASSGATPAAGSVLLSSAPRSGGPVTAPLAFTAADLDAYERGIAREAQLVVAARERGRAAKTPAERAKAAQAEWEDQTAVGGAQAAGMPVARYRQLRGTLHKVLSTLDFQGKIDGPQEMDMSAASPEMKKRLAGDPFAELAPASAAALKARLGSVSKAYIAYMELVAVNG